MTVEKFLSLVEMAGAPPCFPGEAKRRANPCVKLERTGRGWRTGLLTLSDTSGEFLAPVGGGDARYRLFHLSLWCLCVGCGVLVLIFPL